MANEEQLAILRQVVKGELNKTIELNVTITCPQCGFAKTEQMPPDT